MNDLIFTRMYHGWLPTIEESSTARSRRDLAKAVAAILFLVVMLSLVAGR